MITQKESEKIEYIDLFILLLLVPTWMLWAWALRMLWGWFLVPLFALTVPGYTQAIGIGLIVTMFQPFRTTDLTDQEKLKLLGYRVVGPLVAVGIGALVHLAGGQ